jgi:hypothetical protein
MITQLPRSAGKTLGFRFSGKLSDEDYTQFTPLVDAAAAQHGAVRLLIQFEEFDGWEARAMWDDFEFGLQHRKSIERMAVVGEGRMVDWMTKLSRPFTSATVRQFAPEELDAAWAWIEESA